MKAVPAGFPGGLRLQTHKKLTSEGQSRLVPLPERIILPLQQHIGLPPAPLVKVGDTVLKGQIIADSEHYVSVPLHASTSGRVSDLDVYPVAGGRTLCIVIEPDGQDQWSDIRPTQDYQGRDPKVVHKLIRACGIVGLGGAGFPTHVKVQEGVENEVHTLIINGVECEPYITCDDRLIREKAEYVVAGTRMMAHALKAGRSIIAVEEDMPEAATALEQALHGAEDIELIAVATCYPAGGEKQLVQALTGREVPSGGLAIHVGVVVQNVATAAATYRAVTRGEPVVSRYITVTGAVSQPGNLQVLLGSPVSDCLQMCGYDATGGVVLGGPMMGSLLEDTAAPVTKTVNCILAGGAPVADTAEQPCIRCGNCVDVCPVRLMPHELHRAARADDLEGLRELHLFDCIECGCCAYVCPSHIPLVLDYRNAKGAIAAQERRRSGADRARARFEERNARLRQEQQQRTPASAPEDAAERLEYVRQAAERAHDPAD